MWGTTGIGYNSKYVKEGEVDGYEDLFDTQGFLPRHKGKVTMLEEFIEVINAAKPYLRIPLDDWSEEAVERIIEPLKSQKPYLGATWARATLEVSSTARYTPRRPRTATSSWHRMRSPPCATSC